MEFQTPTQEEIIGLNIEGFESVVIVLCYCMRNRYYLAVEQLVSSFWWNFVSFLPS